MAARGMGCSNSSRISRRARATALESISSLWRPACREHAIAAFLSPHFSSLAAPYASHLRLVSSCEVIYRRSLYLLVSPPVRFIFGCAYRRHCVYVSGSSNLVSTCCGAKCVCAATGASTHGRISHANANISSVCLLRLTSFLDPARRRGRNRFLDVCVFVSIFRVMTPHTNVSAPGAAAAADRPILCSSDRWGVWASACAPSIAC